MAKHSKPKIYHFKSKTEENVTTKSFDNSRLRQLFILAIGLLVGYIHREYVSTLLENEKKFSTLSNLEREMSFVTEQGLYYSYFLTVIEAPSFLSGIEALYNNKVTEYPDTINTLQRFNLYPEVILGGCYRVFDYISRWRNWRTKECFNVNRAHGLESISSCRGLGEPTYFYLNGVWLCAGLYLTSIFLLATKISDSIIGGLLTVLCFFYNHGECTRVMWAPPLRESFAYPLVVAQMYLVTSIIKGSFAGTKAQVIKLSLTTALYMSFWQFGQFALFTQVCCLFPIHAIGLISKEAFNTFLKGQMFGLGLALILLFGNKMLLTSWLSSSLLASIWIVYGKEIMENTIKIIRKEESKEEKQEEPKEEMKEKPKEVKKEMKKEDQKSEEQQTFFVFLCLAALKVLAFLFLTVAFKFANAKLLNVKDDTHIFDILRSKFTSYRDFHTQLYTCSNVFDFLGMEMPIKCTETCLIPAVVLVLIVLLVNAVQKYGWPLGKPQNSDLDASLTILDPATLYNVLQLTVYAGMAIMIMRLKMFFTPQLCIVASMLGNKKFIPILRNNERWHAAFFVGLIACMSFKGIANVQHERSIWGEYYNVNMEELVNWINSSTPVDASFAGLMGTMANVLLSTRRPVVNHPHYEDIGIRMRTVKVYQMFSRRRPVEYYHTLREMKVNYLLILNPMCYETIRANKCGLTDLFDLEEPERIGLHNPLCPALYEGRYSKKLFQQVFRNSETTVLKVLEPVPGQGYRKKPN